MKLKLSLSECNTRNVKPGICHTLGHSDLSWEQFIGIIRALRLNTVIDIRSNPSSHRFPRYTRSALEDSLYMTEIEYLYMGRELGGLPADPALWTGSGHVNYGLVSKKPDFRSAIVHLAFLSRLRRPVMLCCEKDPEKCHRYHLVAPHLDAAGIEVHHIVYSPDESDSSDEPDKSDKPDIVCHIHAQTELFRDGLPVL